jgi:ribonuclease E
MEAQPPRVEAERPFGSGNFATISADYDEIDTTPTLEPRPTHEAPRRIDVAEPDDLLAGEVDTTPQPIERPSEMSPGQPTESTPTPQPAAEEENDPNRPKRSGWWQRKSFF